MTTRGEKQQELLQNTAILADALQLAAGSEARNRLMATSVAVSVGSNPNEVMGPRTPAQGRDPLEKAAADMGVLRDEVRIARQSFDRAEALMGTPADVAAAKWQQVASQVAEVSGEGVGAMRDVLASVNNRTAALDLALAHELGHHQDNGRAMSQFLDPATIAPEVKARLKVLAEQGQTPVNGIVDSTASQIAQFDVDTGIRSSVNGQPRSDAEWRAKTVQEVRDPVYWGSVTTTNRVVNAQEERAASTQRQVDAVDAHAAVTRMPEDVREKKKAAILEHQESTPGAVQDLRAEEMGRRTEAARETVRTVEERAAAAGLEPARTWDRVAAVMGSREQQIRDGDATVSDTNEATREWQQTPVPQIPQKVEEKLTPPTLDAAAMQRQPFNTGMRYGAGHQWDVPVDLKLKEGQRAAITNISAIGDSMIELRSNRGDLIFKADDIAGGKSNIAGRAADKTRYIAMLSEDSTRISGNATIQLTEENLRNIKSITRHEDRALHGQRVVIEYNDGKKSDIRAEKVQLQLPEREGNPGQLVDAAMSEVRKARGESDVAAIATTPGRASGPARTGQVIGYIPLADGQKTFVTRQDDGKFVTDRVVANGLGSLVSMDGKSTQNIQIQGGVNVYSAPTSSPQTPAATAGGPAHHAR